MTKVNYKFLEHEDTNVNYMFLEHFEENSTCFASEPSIKYMFLESQDKLAGE